eukprot:3265863-Pyramimonas_sp.AAC.2
MTAPLNPMIKRSTLEQDVMVHLLKEISVRSDSFFQALAVLQDLGVLIHKVCDKIVGLREVVHHLEERLAESAVRVQRLHTRRKNLREMHDMLKLVESMSHSQAALQLLVQSADFAGALDVIDDIRRVSTAYSTHPGVSPKLLDLTDGCGLGKPPFELSHPVPKMKNANTRCTTGQPKFAKCHHNQSAPNARCPNIAGCLRIPTFDAISTPTILIPRRDYAIDR